jgi:hypothetical protein
MISSTEKLPGNRKKKISKYKTSLKDMSSEGVNKTKLTLLQ